MLRPPLIAISILSACVLAYEVVLTRLFSIILWHHFAYMIISAAMLGYGAGGTALTLLKEKFSRHFGTAYVLAATALALLMPVSFLLAQKTLFSPLELLWDPRQPVWLLAVYLLMMLPFFFGGLSIGLAFTLFGRQASRIYAFDIFGAGVGSLGIIGILFFLSPSRVLIVLAALALLAAAIAVMELRMRPRWLAAAFLGLAAAGMTATPDLPVNRSPYKDLSQALEILGSRVIEERSGPLGQMTVVENTHVPLRDAPGMSLNATREPPPQLGVFVDGNGPSTLTHFDGMLGPLDYLGQLTSALPYQILHQPRVLVLGAGAGSDVLQALYHGSSAIDAVELDGNFIDLVGGRFRDFAGNLYGLPNVKVYQAEARGFVSTSRMHYDLIQVALLDSFGTASAGLYGLSESYLYTVEALQTYLNRLAPGGILAFTRWLTLPPRDILKLFATAVFALERSGAADPSMRVAMIRGWKTVTLLVKNDDFSHLEIAAIREFSRTRSFDLAYYPGMPPEEANRYNQLPQPYLFEGALALLGPQRQDFMDRYKFYIEPATDDRPHFFRFFKWDTARELFSLREQGGMPLFDWSYPLLAATLLQACAASVLLILLPLALSRCRRTLPSASVASYFLAIGLAFMFMEIAFIQKFVLFLSHPLYAVSVVLCSFLVFSAAGSRLAGSRQAPNKVTWAITAMAILTLSYLIFLPGLFQSLIHLPDAVKIFISILLIAPLASCMGVPFPSGMTCLASAHPESIPWAWAINGFASVVGAVLATLLAIHLGFAAVIVLAVVIYAGACAVGRGFLTVH